MGRIHFEDINLENNYNPFRAYYQSKLANILFTRELSRRVKEHNIHVYSLHPGGVRTNLSRYLSEGVHPIVSYLFFISGILFFKNAKQGSQTSIYCAVDEEVGTHSGLYYTDCKVTKPGIQATDDKVAKQLWELSLKLCGIQ